MVLYQPHELAGLIQLRTELDCTASTIFPTSVEVWMNNETLAALLCAFENHPGWLQPHVVSRPTHGTVFLYDKRVVNFRRDNHAWACRANKTTTREDHYKLRIKGVERVYGCYSHSAENPGFHRRCYWLLDSPNIVLVHYLFVKDKRPQAGLDKPTGTLPEPPWSQLEAEFRSQLEYAFPTDDDTTVVMAGFEGGPLEPLSWESAGVLTSSLLPAAHLDARAAPFIPTPTATAPLPLRLPTQATPAPLRTSFKPTPSPLIHPAKMCKTEPRGRGLVTSSYTTAPRAPATLFAVSAYAPKACSEEGGVEILVVGLWQWAVSGFSVRLGETVVPAAHVQPGVLSFIFPRSLSPGSIQLEVLKDGLPISTRVPFTVLENPQPQRSATIHTARLQEDLVAMDSEHDRPGVDTSGRTQDLTWRDFLTEEGCQKLQALSLDAGASVESQRRAYVAAQTIQAAFRAYLQRERHRKERAAATIQRHYRQHREHAVRDEAARVIQQHYRHRPGKGHSRRRSLDRHLVHEDAVGRPLLTQREQRAARTILKFMMEHRGSGDDAFA